VASGWWFELNAKLRCQKFKNTSIALWDSNVLVRSAKLAGAIVFTVPTHAALKCCRKFPTTRFLRRKGGGRDAFVVCLITNADIFYYLTGIELGVRRQCGRPTVQSHVSPGCWSGDGWFSALCCLLCHFTFLSNSAVTVQNRPPDIWWPFVGQPSYICLSLRHGERCEAPRLRIKLRKFISCSRSSFLNR
jgi:hypothetical protein